MSFEGDVTSTHARKECIISLQRNSIFNIDHRGRYSHHRLPYLPFAFITRTVNRDKKARSCFILVSELHPLAIPLAFTGAASRWADTHLNLSHVVSRERERNCVVEKSLRRACRDRFLLKYKANDRRSLNNIAVF